MNPKTNISTPQHTWSDAHGVIYSQDLIRLISAGNKAQVKNYTAIYPANTIGEGAFAFSCSLKHINPQGRVDYIAPHVTTEATSVGKTVEEFGLVKQEPAYLGKSHVTENDDVATADTVWGNLFEGFPNSKHELFELKHLFADFYERWKRPMPNGGKIENLTLYSNRIEQFSEASFMFCTRLLTATLPDVTNVIDDYAFAGCIHLKSVSIPDRLLTLGNGAFLFCTDLENIDLGKQLLTISPSAFYHCTSLQNVYLPPKLQSIGSRAFASCHALKSLQLPETVESIGHGAFDWCRSLKSVYLPDSLKSIGDWAFSSCSKLDSISIPDNISVVERGVFADCTALKTLKLPACLETIKESAFRCCESLTTIELPETLTALEQGAFEHCTGLRNIVFPEKLSRITGNPFPDNAGLTVDTSKNPHFHFENGALYTADRKKLIAHTGTDSHFIVPEHVEEIGDYAFFGNATLTTINLGKVKTIGKRAFAWN